MHGKETVWVKVTDPAGVHKPRFRVGQLVLFLPFHPAVLEPDFDLSLGEHERVGDLDTAPPCEISVKVELFF